MIKLQHGELQLLIDPQAGGSVAAFRHGSINLFRPAQIRHGTAFDPLEYAAFPMVPFSGRISNGRFKTPEHQVQLPPNMPPEPHAIHGHGWREAWEISAVTETAATLTYHHEANAWPWTYRAKQDFYLNSDELILDLSVTNLSPTPMPAGLGWHPYFPRNKAMLRMPVTAIWASDTDELPTKPKPLDMSNDLREFRHVEQLNLDHAFDISPGPFELEWRTHAIKLHPDPLFGHAIVYVPPGQDYFCAEPASHAPDAVNLPSHGRDAGLVWLDHNETLTGTVRLKIII